MENILEEVLENRKLGSVATLFKCLKLWLGIIECHCECHHWAVTEVCVYIFLCVFRISFGCCGRYTPADVLAVILSFCIVCVWIMTGHWLLMDGTCSCHIYIFIRSLALPSVLWLCWLGIRKRIWPVKIEWWGFGLVICLERGAEYLHVAQPMPLPLQTPSSLASFKSRLLLPFWYWLTQVVLEKRPLNRCSSSCSSYQDFGIFVNFKTCSSSKILQNKMFA